MQVTHFGIRERNVVAVIVHVHSNGLGFAGIALHVTEPRWMGRDPLARDKHMRCSSQQRIDRTETSAGRLVPIGLRNS